MVALINLLPVIIVLVFLLWAYIGYKKSKDLTKVGLPLAMMLVTLVLYFQLQPSYLPKGEIKRTSIPSFEQKSLEVVDNTPKPMSGEERDQRRKELYKEKLPFVEQNSVDNNK